MKNSVIAETVKAVVYLFLAGVAILGLAVGTGLFFGLVWKTFKLFT